MNKPKLSPQSRSFIVLFIVAIVGVYVCLFVIRSIAVNTDSGTRYYTVSNYQTIVHKPSKLVNAPTPTPTPLESPTQNIAGWKMYNDTTDNLSFLYPPTWKVLKPASSSGFTVVQLDPGSKYYNAKIYISKNGFFALDSPISTSTMIGGESAEDIEGMLYGVTHEGTYYTYDEGTTQSIKSDFEALVYSTKFLK